MGESSEWSGRWKRTAKVWRDTALMLRDDLDSAQQYLTGLICAGARADQAERWARAWKGAAKAARADAHVYESALVDMLEVVKEQTAMVARLADEVAGLQCAVDWYKPALHAIYYGDVSEGFQDWAKRVAGRALGLSGEGEANG